MSGAISRGSTFALERHYTAVAMQQGRVALDADSSEGTGHEGAAATTFGPERHYAGVTLQQGSTQLDNDASDATTQSCPPWVPCALRW
jgi:hypothetical protein